MMSNFTISYCILSCPQVTECEGKSFKKRDISLKYWKVTYLCHKNLNIWSKLWLLPFWQVFNITRSFFNILEKFPRIWVPCRNTKKMRYILFFQSIFFGSPSHFFQYIKRIIYVALHFTKKRLKQKCLRIANTRGKACWY